MWGVEGGWVFYTHFRARPFRGCKFEAYGGVRHGRYSVTGTHRGQYTFLRLSVIAMTGRHPRQGWAKPQNRPHAAMQLLAVLPYPAMHSTESGKATHRLLGVVGSSKLPTRSECLGIGGHG